MKFGPVAPADALGATAVHSIRQDDLVLKKGTLIGPAEVAALKSAGVKEIVVARLEPGDVSEDHAAAGPTRSLITVTSSCRRSLPSRTTRWKSAIAAPNGSAPWPRAAHERARVKASMRFGIFDSNPSGA